MAGFTAVAEAPADARELIPFLICVSKPVCDKYPDRIPLEPREECLAGFLWGVPEINRLLPDVESRNEGSIASD